MQNIIELGFLKILFLHISGIFLEFFLVFFFKSENCCFKVSQTGIGQH